MKCKKTPNLSIKKFCSENALLGKKKFHYETFFLLHLKPLSVSFPSTFIDGYYSISVEI